jgi:hypothetical protein
MVTVKVEVPKIEAVRHYSERVRAFTTSVASGFLSDPLAKRKEEAGVVNADGRPCL